MHNKSVFVVPVDRCGRMVSAYPWGAMNWGTVKPSACLVAESMILVLFKYWMGEDR